MNGKCSRSSGLKSAPQWSAVPKSPCRGICARAWWRDLTCLAGDGRRDAGPTLVDVARLMDVAGAPRPAREARVRPAGEKIHDISRHSKKDQSNPRGATRESVC